MRTFRLNSARRAMLAAAVAAFLTACGGGTDAPAMRDTASDPMAPDSAPAAMPAAGIYEGTLTTPGAGPRNVNTIVLPSGEYYQIYADSGAPDDWQGALHGVGTITPGTRGFATDSATQYKLNMIPRTLGNLALSATYSDPPGRLDGTLQLNVDAMSPATTDFTLASALVPETRLITAPAAGLQIGGHGPDVLSHSVRIKAVEPDNTAYVAQLLVEEIDAAGMFTGTYVIDPADPLCTFTGTLADPAEVAGARALRITFGAGCTVTPEGET